MRDFITASREGDGLTVKRLEGALLRAEERLKAKLDAAKDPGITFEATGIDYLFVDEAHGYKNLRTPSNIPDAAIDGSVRASDLDMKISYLRGRNGARVVTFATATPIANSITEAYVMQRYLRPDLLDAAGIEDFDTWAATFGQTVTAIEMAPEGGDSFRQNTRFARFTNVPEMLRSWHVSADIKTAEDLKLPAPALPPRPGDGQRAPETVVTMPSDAQLDIMADLGERADAIRNRAVRPEEDNMLKVCSDGRKAALDLRLLGQHMDVPGKIGAAADRIAGLWQAHRDDAYPGPGGRESPVRGQPPARVLRPRHARRRLERLRRTPRPARRARPAPADDPLRPRRQDRPGQRRAVRRLPRRHRRRPHRLHREDGRRNQRPAPRRRPAPPRLPLAARRRRPARRPHPAPGQPQRRGADHPLRHRTVLRRLHVADRRTQGPVHRPGHARQARRPRDRGHRRRRPVLQRGQGPGHRQPAADGKSRSRRRADPARTRRTRLEPQPRHPRPQDNRQRRTHRRTGDHRSSHRRRRQQKAGHPRRRVHHDHRREPGTPAGRTQASTSRRSSPPRTRPSPAAGTGGSPSRSANSAASP